MKNLTANCLITLPLTISLSVVAIHAEGIKLYLEGPASAARLISSVPTGGIRQRTVGNGTTTITFGGYYLTEDISGTSYTLNLQCASTSTKNFTAVIRIGALEVVNTTFSVSGEQYTQYNIQVEGIDPDITDSAEVELTVTVDGSGFGVTSGMAWDDRTYSSIVIPPVGAASLTDDARSPPYDIYLSHNYPNPFNSSTAFHFDLPRANRVELSVYDLSGCKTTTLAEGYRPVGRHRVIWDGRASEGEELPSGIYIARLVTPEYSKSIKMLLLR